MFKLNLNSKRGLASLRRVLSIWNDHSGVIRPLVIIKISEAFTMFHETATGDWSVENRGFKDLHPVLINDLETHFNVILALDDAGRMIHAYLTTGDGGLKQNDSLLRFAHKTRHQEYLDYFYCISKNLQRYLDDHADYQDK